MTTWQEDMAANLEFRRQEDAHSVKDSRAPQSRDYQRLFNEVAGFAIDHWEVEEGPYFPVYNTASERLVMRAKGYGLEQATAYVKARGW